MENDKLVIGDEVKFNTIVDNLAQYYVRSINPNGSYTFWCVKSFNGVEVRKMLPNNGRSPLKPYKISRTYVR